MPLANIFSKSIRKEPVPLKQLTLCNTNNMITAKCGLTQPNKSIFVHYSRLCFYNIIMSFSKDRDVGIFYLSTKFELDRSTNNRDLLADEGSIILKASLERVCHLYDKKQDQPELLSPHPRGILNPKIFFLLIFKT